MSIKFKISQWTNVVLQKLKSTKSMRLKNIFIVEPLLIFTINWIRKDNFSCSNIFSPVYTNAIKLKHQQEYDLLIVDCDTLMENTESDEHGWVRHLLITYIKTLSCWVLTCLTTYAFYSLPMVLTRLARKVNIAPASICLHLLDAFVSSHILLKIKSKITIRLCYYQFQKALTVVQILKKNNILVFGCYYS